MNANNLSLKWVSKNMGEWPCLDGRTARERKTTERGTKKWEYVRKYIGKKERENYSCPEIPLIRCTSNFDIPRGSVP